MRIRLFGVVLFLVVGVVAGTANASGFFTDDDNSIHLRAIEAIADEGITKGCNPPVNDLYCPQATVTREQMATFLVRARRYPPRRSELHRHRGLGAREQHRRIGGCGHHQGLQPR